MFKFFESYPLTLGLMGVGMFLSVWIPHVFAGKRITVALLFALMGALIFWLPATEVVPDLFEDRAFWQRSTELVVTLSLLGAGLKIDRALKSSRWRITARLLLITMPLCIAGVGLLGWWVLGLPAASAVLLGAVLAPTDPVLAGDVQVGPPREGEEDEVRFALTSEAGFNDSLAFPFVYMAIMMAEHGASPQGWILEWLSIAVAYKLVVGVLAGVGIGWVLGKMIYSWPRDRPMAAYQGGSVALAALCATYGLTEILEGYGFLAAFVAGIVIRRVEFGHEYNERLHDFTENAEHVLMALLLMCIGGYAWTVFTNHLSWQGILVPLVFMLLIRPAAGMLGLIGLRMPLHEKGVIAYFGVRGLGSIYYVAYALGHVEFEGAATIWSVVLGAIFMSMLLHGMIASPVLARLVPKESSE